MTWRLASYLGVSGKPETPPMMTWRLGPGAGVGPGWPTPVPKEAARGVGGPEKALSVAYIILTC
ncbi:hypothetical protein BD289DRAFT_442927 [Coniella lustricola]|uniref:Uncharacterized protein n=1 Tax=Coniella lustricola TaxID=2025994 RepID=A0A2T2ZXQ8_9PEZI|nr:hypothetical protein BD289DRAFT_442927 [Coniella lustricola]